MKGLSNVVLSILISLITSTGCSDKPLNKQINKQVNQSVNNQVNKKEEYKKSLTYSNLADLSSQDEVKKAMESAGISSENIDCFFQNVINYNNSIEKKSLVEDGFVTINSLEPEYDQSEIDEMWNTKNPKFIGYNCRITSFALIKNLISIGKPNTKNSNQLFMDEDALENSPKKLFNQVEEEKFKTLFSFIPTENTKDISVHLNKVKEDWKSKDIKFLNKDKVSFISVFFHFDEDSYLFIGHAGVLISTADGKLLFVEKLSFQEPYQAIKFDNRIELNDYLMNKYDVSRNQPTAKPFIMENDHLLEGYRKNPNN